MTGVLFAAIAAANIWLTREIRRLRADIHETLQELCATDLALRSRLDERLVDDTVRRFEAQWAAAEQDDEP